MKLQFTKMHGAGNDFIFVNAMERPFNLTEDQIRLLCHRRFGVGCDQLLVVAPSDQADFRMDIYNSDGGRVEMCGNGIRCFAKYVLDKKLTQKTKLEIETLAGIIRPEIIADHKGSDVLTTWVKVDMGEPILEAPKIPARGSGQIVNQPFQVPGDQPLNMNITCVSMGNPHCIAFVDDAEAYPVEAHGRRIETSAFFPNRTNVEFLQVLNPKEIRMRVWERGAGETLACGTGACAALVACVLNGKTGRKATLHLNGGDLEIEWDEKTNRVFMTGPAATVCEGEAYV